MNRKSLFKNIGCGGHGLRGKSQTKVGGHGEPLHDGGYEPILCRYENHSGKWGENMPFLVAPWLNGSKKKYIAPLIFSNSKGKKWNAKKVLHENAWVVKIEVTTKFTFDHLVQFVELWTQLQSIHLNEDIEDNISRTLSLSGQYSAVSAYKARFFEKISTNMNKMVWKIGVPPRIKTFEWLMLKIGF
jgi:hypothetical protein